MTTENARGSLKDQCVWVVLEDEVTQVEVRMTGNKIAGMRLDKPLGESLAVFTYDDVCSSREEALVELLSRLDARIEAMQELRSSVALQVPPEARCMDPSRRRSYDSR